MNRFMSALRFFDFSGCKVGLLVELVSGLVVFLVCLKVLLGTRQLMQRLKQFLVLAESTPVLIHFWSKGALLLFSLF